MGEIRINVALENQVDRILFNQKKLPESKIRGCTVSALVDTGAVMTLLPQDLVEKLGLEMNGKIIVSLADDSKVELSRAKYLSLTVGDRQMDTDCLVGPPQCEPLVGQLVLGRLDLIADSVKRTVVTRPESPFLPSLKMK